MTNRKRLGKPKATSQQILSRKKNRAKKKQGENAKQPINRLPPELLARIFLIGDEEQRSKRLENARYSGFQELTVVSLIFL